MTETPEKNAAMNEFYELMDFITGGPTSEASLAACDMYAAALAKRDAARDEAREAWFAWDRMQARVAELEAAHEWRPVTEDWPPYSIQHLGRATLQSPVMLVTRWVNDDEGGEVWQDSDGLLFQADVIRYCASIPTTEPTP